MFQILIDNPIVVYSSLVITFIISIILVLVSSSKTSSGNKNINEDISMWEKTKILSGIVSMLCIILGVSYYYLKSKP